MSDELSINKELLQEYVVDGNEAVEFRLVHDVSDLDKEDGTFNPEMCHQFFGDGESIFGYRDLLVKLYFSAANLEIYLGQKYAEQISAKKAHGVTADDVIATISEKLPENDYHLSLDNFCKTLEKEKTFRPMGELVHSWKDENDNNTSYEIYLNQGEKSEKYRKYHMRMESFVMWYIDGASYVDLDDINWTSYILYQKQNQAGDSQYTFAGYATVYKYWAYPDKQRPRVSQILILPPFQKRGLGTTLLQTVYNQYITQTDVIDITFEDPADELVRIRDYLDCKNCSKLSSFHSAKLGKGFSQEMKTEAIQKLKIGKKQARRVYEILRLKHTSRSNEAEYKKYRLDVKNRLNATARQEQLNIEKAKKAFKKEGESYAELHSNLENRIEKLDAEYKDLEKNYEQIITRLNRS